MAGHQAVGVEHHHMGVGAAPAADEIADIAGLSARVLRAVPIVDPRRPAKPVAQRQIGALLGDPDVRIGRVREEKPVEIFTEARRLDILDHRLECAEDAARRLVVDRHDDGGAVLQPRRQFRRLGRAEEQPAEADDAAREGDGDPREIGQKQNEQRPFQRRDRADVDDAVHLGRAIGGEREAAAEDDQPRRPGRIGERRHAPAPPALAVEARERLHRHGEVLFGRHRRGRVGRAKVGACGGGVPRLGQDVHR